MRAFTGGAGSGKTYQLIASLEVAINEKPLEPYQKVLALTFMHGSRRRLEEKLSKVNIINRKFECSTIDSFAFRLVSRWATLVSDLGIAKLNVNEYERICDTASLLLKHDFVAKWVTKAFPCILLDEAQDLSVGRLAIFETLEPHVRLFVAADEFQCLDESLNPNPACNWIGKFAGTIDLTIPQRTKNEDLINAANSVRKGNPPVSAKQFRITEGFNYGLAGSWLSNDIGWYGRGKSIAIISPVNGDYMNKVIAWVKTKSTSKKNGPHNIECENSERYLITGFLSNLQIPDLMQVKDVPELVSVGGDIGITKEVERWLAKKNRCSEISTIRGEELIHFIQTCFSRRKRRRLPEKIGKTAMTIHGAKNREFDNVIVLWPASVQGSEDQKRRLLYNAVTRSKEKCLVIVQSKKDLTSCPFV